MEESHDAPRTTALGAGHGESILPFSYLFPFKFKKAHLFANEALELNEKDAMATALYLHGLYALLKKCSTRQRVVCTRRPINAVRRGLLKAINQVGTRSVAVPPCMTDA